MGIAHYLAMTAAEYRYASALPPAIAWMACLFSPYGSGLSNLPQDLPPGSLLMVSDITPIHGHDPDRIQRRLADLLESLSCSAVLLDFQRPGYEEAAALAKHLVTALPCPVGVTPGYAGELDCPVLLPPVPCHSPLSEHLAPWKGREIWLETTLAGDNLTLTADGCTISPLTAVGDSPAFQSESLHCHYLIQDKGENIQFPLWRTRDDHEALLNEAEAQGVTLALGLYQEFM